MQEKLKAFIVTYDVQGKEDLKSLVIVAYTKKEAGDLFITWANATKQYALISGVVVQRLKKTKRNAQYFKKTFYDRQKAFINELSRKENTQA